MKDKAVTIKDVAAQCGCSIATVSYVLNDKPGHTISEEMRKKILQTANYLNYIPNKSARTLVTNRFYNMALCAPPSARLFECAANARMMDGLSKLLRSHGYGLLYHNSDLVEAVDHTDAIFCVGLSRESFYALGDLNFMPLLAVNMVVNDPLFYQINPDYKGLRKRADAFFQSKSYIYAAIPNENRERKQLLEETFENISFVSSMEDVNSLKGENILLTDSILTQELIPYGGKVYYDPIYDQALLSALFTYANRAMGRERVEDKGHFVNL
jgi:DNA-binding LacI/PurR family transcriptional regulator